MLFLRLSVIPLFESLLFGSQGFCRSVCLSVRMFTRPSVSLALFLVLTFWIARSPFLRVDFLRRKFLLRRSSNRPPQPEVVKSASKEGKTNRRPDRRKIHLKMDRWMDGFMDRWMDGFKFGWMDKRRKGWMDGRQTER